MALDGVDARREGGGGLALAGHLVGGEDQPAPQALVVAHPVGLDVERGGRPC